MIEKREKTVPLWKPSLIVNFMISIIVHLHLRGFPLRCYFSMNTIVKSIISRTNKREALFQREGILDRKIGMEPLVINWTKEEAKMAKIIRHIHVYC